MNTFETIVILLNPGGLGAALLWDFSNMPSA